MAKRPNLDEMCWLNGMTLPGRLAVAREISRGTEAQRQTTGNASLRLKVDTPATPQR